MFLKNRKKKKEKKKPFEIGMTTFCQVPEKVFCVVFYTEKVFLKKSEDLTLTEFSY